MKKCCLVIRKMQIKTTVTTTTPPLEWLSGKDWSPWFLVRGPTPARKASFPLVGVKMV